MSVRSAGTGVTEPLAGGTDLMARLRTGLSAGPVEPLTRAELRALDRHDDGGLSLGALVTVEEVAGLHDTHPALAAAAGALATPQIRRVATLGGNLLQHNRCWYYRNPAVDCFRKGGTTCPARAGNHRYGALFDLGPCVAVHPSTLGAALLTYPGSTVDTDRRTGLAVADLFGDGTDARHDHQLGTGEILLAVHLPPPVPGERGVYHRTTGRATAEWPLVEVVVGLVVDDRRVREARIAAGGVAPVPLRLYRCEEALNGETVTTASLAAAAAVADDGATPLPMTRYKRRLLVGGVLEALERAAL